MLGSWIQKKMTTAKKTKTHFQNSATVGKSSKKSLKLDHFSKSFLKLIEFLSHFIIEKSPKSAFTKWDFWVIFAHCAFLAALSRQIIIPPIFKMFGSSPLFSNSVSQPIFIHFYSQKNCHKNVCKSIPIYSWRNNNSYIFCRTLTSHCYAERLRDYFFSR